MARQQARRRNRERLTGIILAGLGVVVLVVAAIALASPGGNEQTAAPRSSTSAPSTSPSPTTSARPTRSATPTPTSPGPSLSLGNSSGSGSSAKRLPIVVLNNTTTNGLATTAADRFRNGGWKVSDVGNLTNDILSTCAYYDPDVRGSKSAAEALQEQFPAIKRVAERFGELPSGPIVVVLTSDYDAG